MQICEELALYDSLRLNPASMQRFIRNIENGYRDNPYHNKFHAATVTITMYQILTYSGILTDEKLSDQVKPYLLAAVIAAAVHDVNHPGVGNEFRVRMVSHICSLGHTHHLSVCGWQSLDNHLCPAPVGHSRAMCQI